MSGPPRLPIALCLTDREPLVLTKEHPGYDFICGRCGRKHTLVEPAVGFATDEARARQRQHQERYEADLKRRIDRSGS